MEGAAAAVNVFRQTEKRFQGKADGGGGCQQQQKRRRRKEKRSALADGGEGGEEELNLPWAEVIDFSNLEANSPANRSLIVEVPSPAQSGANSDIHDSTCTAAAPPPVTKIYALKDTPGFAFIPNPFTDEQQLYWADLCVREYVEAPPGITNLAAHHPAADLTRLLSRAFPPAASPSTTTTAAQASSLDHAGAADGARETKRSKTSEAEEAEDGTADAAPHPRPIGRAGARPAVTEQALLWRLRWTTLGYHYDWTNRKYHEHHRDDLPADLAHLCQHFAAAAGMSLACQAAIVNYYAPETVLCGHLDDVELTFEAPIVSISLGLSAIFLLGGRTREEKPRAMLLRSGDVVVMGGASRLLYHGVPRILPATLPPSLADLSVAHAHHGTSRESAQPHLANVVEYLSKRRININARQVLASGCGFPSSSPPPSSS